MTQSASARYEAPRAVRLADAVTGATWGWCQDGSTPTPAECANGDDFLPFCGPTGAVPVLCANGTSQW